MRPRSRHNERTSVGGTNNGVRGRVLLMLAIGTPPANRLTFASHNLEPCNASRNKAAQAARNESRAPFRGQAQAEHRAAGRQRTRPLRTRRQHAQSSGLARAWLVFGLFLFRFSGSHGDDTRVVKGRQPHVTPTWKSGRAQNGGLQSIIHGPESGQRNRPLFGWDTRLRLRDARLRPAVCFEPRCVERNRTGEGQQD